MPLQGPVAVIRSLACPEQVECFCILDCVEEAAAE
jgi:hypothetical protein